MKPKNNYKPGSVDECQTPYYGVKPLFEFLPRGKTIWEPAAGIGIMLDTLQTHGWNVVATTIETGFDFFDCPIPNYDIHVTNPPYGRKYQWLERCYELGKPFALLMPVEMIGAARAQRCFDKYGIEIIYLDKRIDFIMPNKKLDGHGAQFPTAWYTWGLNIGRQITFRKLDKPSHTDIMAWWEEWRHLFEPQLR